MGDVINLRRERKRRDKAGEAKRAAASRTVHGLTKSQKQSARVENETFERRLDDHLLSADRAKDEPLRDA